MVRGIRPMIHTPLKWGSYKCQRCGKDYNVNEPGTWRLCTPEICHDCYAAVQAHLAEANRRANG
jgi:hypothetical protein